MKIRITMFSDYICPFCYLGKAIIDRLKSRFDIELEHVGIEIHPETPICGVDLRKYISETNEMYQHLRSRSKEYGLNFCDVRTLPNSRKALIVGEYSRKLGKMRNSLIQYSKRILKTALTSEKKRSLSK